jgi:hypothetical protein
VGEKNPHHDRDDDGDDRVVERLQPGGARPASPTSARWPTSRGPATARLLWAGIHGVAFRHPQPVAPLQGVYVVDAVFDHQQRRTGAGSLVGSGTVGDDRPGLLAQLGQVAGHDGQGNKLGPGDVSLLIFGGRAYIDHGDRVLREELLKLLLLHSRNAVRGGLCEAERRETKGHDSG